MKPFYLLLAACLLTFAPVSHAQDQTAEDEYFDVYTLIRQGDSYSAKGKDAKAHENYLAAQKALKQLQADYPFFQPKVIKYRLDYLDGRLSAAPAVPGAKLPPASAGSGGIDVAAMSETVTPGDSDQPVAFKTRWDAGKRYKQEVKLGAALEVTIPAELAGEIGGGAKPAGGAKAQTMKADVKLDEDLAIAVVKERDNGGRELELEFGSPTLEVKADGKTVLSFNPGASSANVLPDPEIGAALKRLSGAKVKLLTDADCRVESVEGLEEFLAKIGGAAIPDPKVLMTNFTPEMQRNLLQSQAGSGFTPDHPVKVGESWSKSSEVKAAEVGDFKSTMDYTFKGWADHNQHKCAVIDFKGNFQPGAEASSGAASPVSLSLKMTGRTWFDPELGTVVETLVLPDMQLKINLGAVISAKLSLQADTRLAEVADLPK